MFYFLLIIVSCKDEEIRPMKYSWNGEIFDCEIHLLNGNKNIVKCYSDNGVLILTHGYREDKPHGEYTKYYNDGSIKEVGIFCFGEFCKNSRKFFKNGSLKSKSYYLNVGKGIYSSTVYFKEMASDGRLIGSHIPRNISVTRKEDSIKVDFKIPFSEYAKPFYLLILDKSSSFAGQKDTVFHEHNMFSYIGVCENKKNCIFKGEVIELDGSNPDFIEDTLAFFSFEEVIEFNN